MPEAEQINTSRSEALQPDIIVAEDRLVDEMALALAAIARQMYAVEKLKING